MGLSVVCTLSIFQGGVGFRLNAAFIAFLSGMARKGQRVPLRTPTVRKVGMCHEGMT